MTARVLERVSATDRGFPHAGLDSLFQEVARRVPAAIAVRDGDRELTYRELDRAAAEQARLLRRAGVRPGDRVLIDLGRSAAEIVAVLGTLYAGAVYVGIDLGQPAGHLAAVVARCAPAAVLARAPLPEPVASVPAVPGWSPSWAAAAEVPRTGSAENGDSRLAYIAFTSGSTGDPKGVCVPQRGVIRLVYGADYLRLGPGDRMLRLSPLAFDASTLELWGALLRGATLEIYPESLPSPSELGEFLLERQVTVAWLTAGLFRLIADFAPDSLRGMRQVLSGGDVVPHEHVRRLLARHPGLVITNGYGPTENTTFTTVYTVTSPQDVDGPLPIGSPVAGTQVYVLDEQGRQVPPGVAGELYTGGAGLADGYLEDEAETARRFGFFSPDVPQRLYRTGDLVRLDADGQLCFLGRNDGQVKLRGYRVELSGVTAALTALPGVRDADVFAVGTDAASKRLVAALVGTAGAELDIARVRQALADRLPAYMIPARWAVVDRFPVTANGKIDRKALDALAVTVR